MRIHLSASSTYQALPHSDKLEPAELSEYNSLMTTLFKDRTLQSPAASRLDFLSKKLERAPFVLKPSLSTPHLLELIPQPEAVAQTKLEQTPLHELVREGSAADVKAMVAQHPEWVHTRNARGQTPLAIAIEWQKKDFKRLDVVKILVEAGADVNLGDKDHWTPLYRASRAERLDILNYLAPLGVKEDVNQPNLDAQSTPLMRMADSGSVEGVQKLLEMGADPNAINDLGSCVYYAAKNGNGELVALLHERAGADLNRVKDALGFTPLGVAVINDHAAVADYLRSKGAAEKPLEKDFTPLHKLVLFGDAQAIIDSANRGEKDEHGRSVAHYCAALGKLDLLRKIDPKRLDEPDIIYKRPPLHYAVIHGQEEAVRWLITEGGCQLYSQDKAKHFPLTWAAQFGREGIARLLLRTAAAKGEKEKMLQQTDNYGWPAFLKAAKHNHVGLVKMFVKEFAVDPQKQKSTSGMTALELAKEGHAQAVIDFLSS